LWHIAQFVLQSSAPREGFPRLASTISASGIGGPGARLAMYAAICWISVSVNST
jgi:hypothetical protein